MTIDDTLARLVEADMPGVSATLMEEHLVVPTWLMRCSFQQQSVLLLALRGPDGVRKLHPAKAVHIAYRGTLLRAADTGEFLSVGEGGTFMSLTAFGDSGVWESHVRIFFAHVDELPHHYVAHLAHAAQILGHVHPTERVRLAWGWFYACWCGDLHVEPESRQRMNDRLGDWGGARERLLSLGFEYPTSEFPS